MKLRKTGEPVCPGSALLEETSAHALDKLLDNNGRYSRPSHGLALRRRRFGNLARPRLVSASSIIASSGLAMVFVNPGICSVARFGIAPALVPCGPLGP